MFDLLRSLAREVVGAVTRVVRRVVSWVADRVADVVEQVAEPVADVVTTLVEIHRSLVRTSPGYRAGLATVLGRVLMVVPMPAWLKRAVWLLLVAWLEAAATTGGVELDDGEDW